MTDSTPKTKLTPRNLMLALIQILVLGLAGYFGYECGCDNGHCEIKGVEQPVVNEDVA